MANGEGPIQGMPPGPVPDPITQRILRGVPVFVKSEPALGVRLLYIDTPAEQIVVVVPNALAERLGHQLSAPSVHMPGDGS